MPPVINTDIYNVIKDFNLNELKETYQECGLTRLEMEMEMEMEAVMARAQAFKIMSKSSTVNN
jgi:hypothetical protein